MFDGDSTRVKAPLTRVGLVRPGHGVIRNRRRAGLQRSRGDLVVCFSPVRGLKHRALSLGAAGMIVVLAGANAPVASSQDALSLIHI